MTPPISHTDWLVYTISFEEDGKVPKNVLLPCNTGNFLAEIRGYLTHIVRRGAEKLGITSF